LLLAGPVAIGAESFTGKVIGVTDGDTITVLVERRPVKARHVRRACPFTRGGVLGHALTIFGHRATEMRDPGGRVEPNRGTAGPGQSG